jgi:hypothetical protein
MLHTPYSILYTPYAILRTHAAVDNVVFTAVVFTCCFHFSLLFGPLLLDPSCLPQVDTSTLAEYLIEWDCSYVIGGQTYDALPKLRAVKVRVDCRLNTWCSE